VGNWLAIAAAFGGFGAAFYGLRRLVAAQTQKICAVLDPCEYVILETAPEQLNDVRADFERNGWRAETSKSTSGRGILTTFVRSSKQAALLSEMLGVGGKRPLASAKMSNSDFQMKIKAHGPLSDLRA
jgi:hypothetical protein